MRRPRARLSSARAARQSGFDGISAYSARVHDEITGAQWAGSGQPLGTVNAAHALQCGCVSVAQVATGPQDACRGSHRICGATFWFEDNFELWG